MNGKAACGRYHFARRVIRQSSAVGCRKTNYRARGTGNFPSSTAALSAQENDAFCYTQLSARFLPIDTRPGRIEARGSSNRVRGVAQPGRAPGSGPGGRRFESSLPDQ